MDNINYNAGNFKKNKPIQVNPIIIFSSGKVEYLSSTYSLFVQWSEYYSAELQDVFGQDSTAMLVKDKTTHQQLVSTAEACRGEKQQ